MTTIWTTSTIHHLSHPTLAQSPTLPSPTPQARRARPLSKVWKLRLLGARITEIVERRLVHHSCYTFPKFPYPVWSSLLPGTTRPSLSHASLYFQNPLQPILPPPLDMPPNGYLAI